jgi:hypothetical protein
VKCPRIREAPAALECRRYLTLGVGRSREIILGEVLGVFIRAGAVDPVTKYVDQQKMDAIGRLGGTATPAPETSSTSRRPRSPNGNGATASQSQQPPRRATPRTLGSHIEEGDGTMGSINLTRREMLGGAAAGTLLAAGVLPAHAATTVGFIYVGPLTTGAEPGPCRRGEGARRAASR